MALVECQPTDLLKPDYLTNHFYSIISHTLEAKEIPLKKEKKKNKNKNLSVERKPNYERGCPRVDIHSNPSPFGVLHTLRQIVLCDKSNETSKIYLRSVLRSIVVDGEDDVEAINADAALKLPKVVLLGICGVFDILREARNFHPSLCCRTLETLLNILQGQTPEGLKNEPSSVIENLFNLLLDLSHDPPFDADSDQSRLSSLACACLLSLVVARGDTGMLLSAVSATLMTPRVATSQQIMMPEVICQLQRSVRSVLIGSRHIPEWVEQGVRTDALLHASTLYSAKALQEEKSNGQFSSSLASNGKFLFIHDTDGICKVGTGYGGTIQGQVYSQTAEFSTKAPGWLTYYKGYLLYKDPNGSKQKLLKINPDTLQSEGFYHLKFDVSIPHILFNDGKNIGHIAASKEDAFIVTTLSLSDQSLVSSSELQLKLARKTVDSWGVALWDGEKGIHTIASWSEDSCSMVAAGREFILFRTSSGKVLYSGKGAALGLKHGNAGKLSELPIGRSAKISQVTSGHDCGHALMITDDGQLYFVGTPKRGEDGEQSVGKGRRAPKPIKPKRISRLEGSVVTATACNSGTSAVITKDGALFLFGKDTTHCDSTTGRVTDLKDVVVTQASLGKAHIIALSEQGVVYSFGINNKGQCGRDYIEGMGRDFSTVITMAEDDEEELKFCPPGSPIFDQFKLLLPILRRAFVDHGAVYGLRELRRMHGIRVGLHK